MRGVDGASHRSVKVHDRRCSRTCDGMRWRVVVRAWCVWRTYLWIAGRVASGLGKGVTISSIGVLLKAWGLHVTSVKIDPYLNIDAGTMNPMEHGEVFVLDDGGETDLDLGTYVVCFLCGTRGIKD